MWIRGFSIAIAGSLWHVLANCRVLEGALAILILKKKDRVERMPRKAQFFLVLLVVACVAAMLSSCSKKDIHLADYDLLQEGVSTKKDVVRIYGKPKFVLPHMDGGETWSYDRDYSGDFVDRNYVFKFHFDRRGVLREKSHFLSKWP